MNAIFENGTRTITLIEKSESATATYTHKIEISIDGDIDIVTIDMKRNNNIQNWLQDNCDIEGTKDNCDLFLTLI